MSEDVGGAISFFFGSGNRPIGGPALEQVAMEIGPSCLFHSSVSFLGPKVEDTT